jgi:hypothetical protein
MKESEIKFRKLWSWNAVILIGLLTTSSCKDSTVNDIDGIVGSYNAVIFREPGSSDGGVDILREGGGLTLRLWSDFRAEGKLFIPENIGSNYPPTDTNYSGTLDLNRDTIRVRSTQTLLDQFPLIAKDHRLETPDMPGRMATFKIIFEKQ